METNSINITAQTTKYPKLVGYLKLSKLRLGSLVVFSAIVTYFTLTDNIQWKYNSMSINTKIFQIYFKPELKSQCDSLFTPLDNTANPRPELREWDVWNREHETILEQNLDLWGFVSWKFKEKTNLSAEQAFAHINDNPGYDVYLFNPCIVNEALFTNNWEQGDIHHPGISQIGNAFFAKLGYDDVDVVSILDCEQSK